MTILTTTAVRRWAAIAATVAGIAVSSAAVAQQGDIESAREERRELAMSEARVAARLDILAARDAELVAALDDLDRGVEAIEARIQIAQSRIEDARERGREAQRQATNTAADIESLRSLATSRMVDLYVDGAGLDPAAKALLNGEITGSAMTRAIVELESLDAADVVDQLRVAERRQADLVVEADNARLDARAARAELRAELSGLRDLRRARVKARAEVDERVRALEEEAASLVEADQKLEAFIQDELARRAAEQAKAEAERQARAEAEAQAAVDTEQSPGASPDSIPSVLPDDTEPTQPDTTARQPEGDDEPGSAERPASSNSGMIWPAGGSISSPFGNRVHPIYGTVRFHAGIDLAAPSGTPLMAALPGTVISAGWQDGYGETVIIDHGGGMTTVYPHMSGYNTSTGDTVDQGVVIGYVGSTGNSTGPHLHFEVRLNGVAQDPMLYLP